MYWDAVLFLLVSFFNYICTYSFLQRICYSQLSYEICSSSTACTCFHFLLSTLPLPRPSPPTAVWYSIFCCFCFYFYFFFRFLFIHFFLCLCHFCGYHKLVRRATFPMWKIEMCFFFLEVGLEAVATPTGCREWRMGGGWRTQDGSCEQIYGSPKRDDA